MSTNYGTFDTSTRANFPHSINAEDTVDIKIKHCSLKYLLDLEKRLKGELIQNTATALIQNLVRKRQAKKRYQMKKVEVLSKASEVSKKKFDEYINYLTKIDAYPFFERSSDSDEDVENEEEDSDLDDSEPDDSESDDSDDSDTDGSDSEESESENFKKFLLIKITRRKNAAKKIQRVVRSRKRKINTMKEIYQVMPVTLFTIIACLTSFTVTAAIL